MDSLPAGPQGKREENVFPQTLGGGLQKQQSDDKRDESGAGYEQALKIEVEGEIPFFVDLGESERQEERRDPCQDVAGLGKEIKCDYGRQDQVILEIPYLERQQAEIKKQYSEWHDCHGGRIVPDVQSQNVRLPVS